jgi:hypothetical protein
MSKPAAFRAAYSDLKVIKTRKCVQIIFEVPTEQFDDAYEVLGGLPNPASERWFAVAAIQTQTEFAPVSAAASPQPVPDKPQAGGKRKDWRDLPPSQQAALRCNNATFEAFLKEEHPDDWHEAGADAAECVRLICGVASRSWLDKDHRARVVWKQLDDQFQAWERVGA